MLLYICKGWFGIAHSYSSILCKVMVFDLNALDRYSFADFGDK